MTTTIVSTRPSAAEEARRHHDAYMAHVRHCDTCVGRLCPIGRDLELDADAAGWRAEHAPADVLTIIDGVVWWSAAA